MDFIDIENNVHATAESVFKLWSIAKVFAELEIFREIEEGLIDLDDPNRNTCRSSIFEAEPVITKNICIFARISNNQNTVQ